MAFITTAHVDGACDQTKTKAGGWAVVINNGERVVSGRAQHTTNNVMELTAIRVALTSTIGPVDIRSDSEWAIKSLTGEYKATANLDLIKEIRELMAPRKVTLSWIGRNSEPSHERADAMAKREKEIAIHDFNVKTPVPPTGVDKSKTEA